jgi:hypothetical protein
MELWSPFRTWAQRRAFFSAFSFVTLGLWEDLNAESCTDDFIFVGKKQSDMACDARCSFQMHENTHIQTTAVFAC